MRPLPFDVSRNASRSADSLPRAASHALRLASTPLPDERAIQALPSVGIAVQRRTPHAMLQPVSVSPRRFPCAVLRRDFAPREATSVDAARCLLPVRATSLMFFAAICCCSGSAWANEETFSYAQTPSGNVLVTLNGIIPFCDDLLGGFVGSPTRSVVSYQVSFSSAIVEGECNPPPVIPPPQPYSLTIDAGTLADGTYSVTWSFVDASPGQFLPPQNFLSSFTVAEGSLIIFRDGFEAR